MKPSRLKPISQLRTRAPEVLRELAECREPVVLTVNGKEKAVLQDIASYEEQQDALALLKLLAVAGKEIEQGRAAPAHQVFARLRRRKRP